MSGTRAVAALLVPVGAVAFFGQNILAGGTARTIAAFVLIIGFALIFHEAGHFLIAKLLGIRVGVFSIGVGPKIFGFRRRGTEYRLCPIPLAAYVRIVGMAPEEIDEPEGFYSAPVTGRLAVLLGGSAMNIFLAFLILLVYACAFGLGEFRPGVLGVAPDMPAARAGIKANDVFVSVAGEKVERLEDVIRLLAPRAGKRTEIVVERGGKRLRFSIVPTALRVDAADAARLSDPKAGFVLKEGDMRGVIGVRPGLVPTHIRAPALAYPLRALDQTQKLIWRSVAAVVALIYKPEARQELVGPVGIVQVTAQSAEMGLLPVLELAAVLNVWLAVFNLLPIPVLDGSRVWITVIEAARRRIFDKEREAVFHFAGLVLLILVVLLITAANDIPRLIRQ